MFTTFFNIILWGWTASTTNQITTKDMQAENSIFPIPFKLNGIWSQWQFSFRFFEPNGIPFGSKSKGKLWFDFELNGIPFDSRSRGKLSPRSYPIQFERNWKYRFLSASCPDWKNYSDGACSWGETSFSRHHGGQIEGPPSQYHGAYWGPPPLSASWGPSWEPPETLPTSGQYSTVEFKGDPHLGPHQTPFRWRNFCLSWAQTA